MVIIITTIMIIIMTTTTPDLGRGRMGSALMGSLLIVYVWPEVLFGYQSAQICQHTSIVRTFFPNLSRLITFAAALWVLTPQPRSTHAMAIVDKSSCLFPSTPTHRPTLEAQTNKSQGKRLRPISVLRLSLLRLLDSNFPGNLLWTWEFHPLELRLCLSQTLWNP